MIGTDYIFGRKNRVVISKPNLFIGGVANTIADASTLASIFNISSQEISLFNKMGSDIEAKIDVPYASPDWSITSITNFEDLENCISLGRFNDMPLLEKLKATAAVSASNLLIRNTPCREVFLPDLSSAPRDMFYSLNFDKIQIIYIPKAKPLGHTLTGNDGVFNFIDPYTHIYVHPSLATANNGAPDQDLIYAESRGAVVRYVQNYNQPNLISNLSISEVYATRVKLDFTKPSSLNTIEFYEVYIDGKLNSRHFDASEVYALGLTPNSPTGSIAVKAVDIYYNKSELSNNISGTTIDFNTDFANGLINYYPLNEPILNRIHDAISKKFGATQGAVTKVGTAFQLGTEKFIELSNLLGGRTVFSLSFWFKNISGGVFYGQWDSNRILLRLNGSNLQFYTFTTGQKGGTFFSGFSDTSNWHYLTLTYDGSVMKMMLDGVESGSTYAQTGAMASDDSRPETIGKERNNYGNVIVEKLSIHNRAITLAEHTNYMSI